MKLYKAHVWAKRQGAEDKVCGTLGERYCWYSLHLKSADGEMLCLMRPEQFEPAFGLRLKPGEVAEVAVTMRVLVRMRRVKEKN